MMRPTWGVEVLKDHLCYLRAYYARTDKITYSYSLIIRTLVLGTSVHKFRPPKPGHLTNKDTSLIRTLADGGS